MSGARARGDVEFHERSSADHRSVAVKGMDPFTLHFKDLEMEAELRADTVEAAYSIVVLFGVLNLVFNIYSGILTMSITLVWIVGAYVSCAGVMRLAWVYRVRCDMHTVAARLWTATWAFSIVNFLYLVNIGRLARLTADEGHKAAAACATWVLVAVVQHTVHLGASYRFAVLAFALTIILSSSVWRAELLASLLIGETSGYAIEHMLRQAFLRRVAHVDRLRVEKERVMYDFALSEARHRQAASEASKPVSSRASRNSGRGSRSSGRASRTPPRERLGRCESMSEPGSSVGGSNSELAMLLGEDGEGRCPSCGISGGLTGLDGGLDGGLGCGASHASSAGGSGGKSEGDDDEVGRQLSSERAGALWRTLAASNLYPHEAQGHGQARRRSNANGNGRRERR